MDGPSVLLRCAGPCSLGQYRAKCPLWRHLEHFKSSPVLLMNGHTDRWCPVNRQFSHTYSTEYPIGVGKLAGGKLKFRLLAPEGTPPDPGTGGGGGGNGCKNGLFPAAVGAAAAAAPTVGVGGVDDAPGGHGGGGSGGAAPLFTVAPVTEAAGP